MVYPVVVLGDVVVTAWTSFGPICCHAVAKAGERCSGARLDAVTGDENVSRTIGKFAWRTCVTCARADTIVGDDVAPAVATTPEVEAIAAIASIRNVFTSKH